MRSNSAINKSVRMKHRGRLRIGDDWNAITIIALSQNNPLKAIAEFIENSIDAQAKHIKIIRGKEHGEQYIRVIDDGQGIPCTEEGMPDFKYVATHICDSLKRRLREGGAQNIQGEFGIGLLSFWTVGHKLLMVSSGKDGKTYQMNMEKGKPGYAIAPRPHLLPMQGTQLTIAPLLAGIRTLNGEKIQRYLASELRDRIRHTGVKIKIIDRTSRSEYEVEPRRYEGRLIHDILSITTPFGDIYVEVYLAEKNAENCISLFRSGTRLLPNISALDFFQCEPWISGYFQGIIDVPFLHLTPGTRDGVIRDEYFAGFCDYTRPLKEHLAKIALEQKGAEDERMSKNILRSVQKALREAMFILPPVTFTYQSGINGWTENSTWTIPDGSFVDGNTDQGRCLVDLNGDGLPEFMIAIASQTGSWYEKTYKNTGNGWVADPGWTAPNGNFIWVTQGKNIDDGRRLVDVNGDGFPDWIVANKYWTGGSDYNYGTYLNGKTYWQTTSSNQWNIPDGFFASIGADQGRRFADVNGDGIVDFLVAKDGTRVTYLNNGNGWTRTDSMNVPDGDFSQGAQLIDINGDGLADLVIAKDGTKAVYINNGKGWTLDNTWNIPDGNFYESGKPCGRVLTDINGDGLPDLVIAQDGYKTTYINTGHGWQKNDSWNITDGEIMTGGQDQGRRFSDVNGDGMVDLVIGNGSYKKTYLNASPVPDLLQKISNGTGGSTTIGYTPSTKYYNNGPDSICDLPIILQTVSSVTNDDGMGHTYTVTHQYWDGMFDVQNREFLGFDQVREIDGDGNYVDNWFKQDPKYKGRLYLQETKDKSGNLYSRLYNNWDCFEPYTGVYLPYLKSQDRYIYDGGDANTFKRTQTSYEYDSYGNPTKISYSGDDTAGWGTILGDEKYTYIEYVYNQDKWILNKASHSYATDSNGNKVSEGWRYYDNNSSWYGVTPTLGRLTKEEKWSNSSSNATIAYVYDAYGNTASVTDPKGRVTTTTYDSTYHMYPSVVTNALGQTQSATYDPKTGQILTSTDPNSQVSTKSYDTFGRVQQVFGPYDDASHPAIWYEYDLSAVPIKGVAYAREENNTNDSNKIRTVYTFSDGLGRTIEVKSDAQDSSKQVISNVVAYNNRSLTDSKFLPYFITPGTDRAKYTVPDFTQPKASFQYDPVGRIIKIINSDNTYRTSTYVRSVETITDENGHQKRSTKDIYGRIAKVEEFNGSSVYITTYAYNTLDNLTKTVDTLGNTSTVQYDSLGRKISMNDPDMGSWSYLYDEVGNLKSQTDAKGQTITFTYDNLNRLTKKTYPSGTPAVYTYDTYPTGSSTGPYAVGRLTSVSDASGVTLFYYDKLGREIKTVKTVDGTSYTAQRSYDALGKLVSVTSPDNETITYTYNRQSGIDRVVGNRTYVSNVTYSATGQILSLTYGNGTVTNYQYDPKTLRLTHLVTQDSQSTKVQDLSYTFDSIGNVKAMTDASATGTNTQSFEYDDLSRLTKSIGAGYGTINYQYDPIGNMTQKGDLTLAYPAAGSAKPHAVKTVTRNSQAVYAPIYDANGNMTQKGSQVLQYDCENRLVQVGSSQTSSPVSVQITLKPGMNLISLPVVPSDTSILNALSSIRFGTDYTQVSRYNAVSKAFEHWVNNPKFDQFKTLEYGVGYQIYVSNSSGCTLTITGNYPSQTSSIPLVLGYNLIGAPTATSKSVIESLSNLKFGTDYDKVARYNTTTKAFEYFYNNPSLDNFTMMDKGYAYYVHMLKVATWQIPLVFQGTTTFVYDGDGGRVKKVSSDGTQSIYVGPGYEVIKNPDNTTNIIKSVFLGSNRVCETYGGGVYYFHRDNIGSSNVITDSTGKQVTCYEYKPYGETSKASGSFSTDIRYTGQRLDNSTSFYYYGARYYDPELGRFIQPDTIIQAPFDPQSLNRYSYCRNNPINYTDPSGHFWWLIFIIIAAIIGGIAGGVAAHNAGGNVIAGIAIGFIAGAALAGASMLVAGVMMEAFGAASLASLTIGQGALIGATTGAISGFGMGMVTGWAGGKGSASDIFKSAASGMLWGAATGAITGAATTAIAKGIESSREASRALTIKAQNGLAIDNKPVISTAASKSPDGPCTVGNRYVGSAEAAEAAKTGYVPNTTQAGDPKIVFYTPDEAVSSASQAQSMYSIEDAPTYRITIDTSRTTNIYAGQVNGSTGYEITTADRIPVLGIEKLGE